MEIIMDRGQAIKQIKSVATKRIALVALVQQLAVTAIYHAQKHGDIDMANALCTAVGGGMKHEALKLYLSEFGPFNPDGKDKALKYAKSKRVTVVDGVADDVEVQAKVDAAVAVEWHSYKTEKPAEEWTFAQGLHALLNKLKKATDDGLELSEAEQKLVAEIKHAAATTIPKPVKA